MTETHRELALKLQEILNRVPIGRVKLMYFHQNRLLTSTAQRPCFPLFCFVFWRGTHRSHSPLLKRSLKKPTGDGHQGTVSAGGRQGLKDAPRLLCQGESIQFAHLCLPAWDLLGCHVAPGMLCQVVAPHEASVTHRTHKLLLPSVSSAVARQFI